MNENVNTGTVYLEVISITEIGEGMRACIDFVDVLQPEDGLYVGNTGHGYIKVLSENRASDGYPPRPFRINCGAFHQYVIQKDKTYYLHEIKPGETLYKSDAKTEKTNQVRRLKIKKMIQLRNECKNKENCTNI